MTLPRDLYDGAERFSVELADWVDATEIVRVERERFPAKDDCPAFAVVRLYARDDQLRPRWVLLDDVAADALIITLYAPSLVALDPAWHDKVDLHRRSAAYATFTALRQRWGFA